MRDTETLAESAGRCRAAAPPQHPPGMRQAPAPPRGLGRGPAAARRRGGRAAARPAHRLGTGKQSPGSGRDAPTPPPLARRRDSCPDLRPPPAGDLRRREPEEPEAPACAPRPQPCPAGTVKALALTTPPAHPRGCFEAQGDLSAPGVPTFSSQLHHHGSPLLPARSQAGRERAPTSQSGRHRRCQAARLPGPAPPPPGPRPLRPPRP